LEAGEKVGGLSLGGGPAYKGQEKERRHPQRERLPSSPTGSEMKIRLLYIALNLCMLLLAIPAQSLAAEENVTKQPPPGEPNEDCPTVEACKLWEEFKAKYGERWTIKWHGDRNIPRRISGKYQLDREIKTKGDAEAVASGIIEGSKDLIGIDEDDVSDLKLRRVLEDKWTFIPEFDQYYKGVPVYGGEVRVILSKNNTFEGMTNNFYPGIDISTEPKISRSEAVRIAEDEIRGYRRVESVELYILPRAKGWRLDYLLTWRTYFKGAFFFIDAESGEIVHREYTVAVDTVPPSGGRDGVAGGLGFLWPVIALALLLVLAFILWGWRR
jgi:hypothetical protein